jgi:hypothetical protein
METMPQSKENKFSKEQIRDQYLANQLFLIGEKVGSDLEVIDRRANYIVVVNGSGEIKKMFLDEAFDVKFPEEKSPLVFSTFTSLLDEGVFTYKGYKTRNFHQHPEAQTVFESLAKDATDPYAVLSAIKHVDIFFEKNDEHSLEIAKKAVSKIDILENHSYLNETASVYNDNFKNWFDGAHDLMKNEDGTPKTFYHGTNKDFDHFDGPSHFSPSPQIASDHADWRVDQNGGQSNVIPVHLNIKNPMIMDDPSAIAYEHGEIENIKNLGHDGVMSSDGMEFIAFHPHQIKSVFNKGTWSPKTKNISEDTLSDEEIDFKFEEKLTYSTLAAFLTESFEQHVNHVMDHLEKNPKELDELADHVKTIAHIAHHYDQHSVHMGSKTIESKTVKEETEGNAIEHAEPGRRISVRKLSSGPQLIKIAKRAAVELIAQKLANKPIKKISNKEKNEIVKTIRKSKTVVMRLARKLVPKIQRIEHENHENEEFGSSE